jgi:pimeloyl-ACP methyl ester carboxylesterase
MSGQIHAVVTGPAAPHGTLLLHGAGGSPEANFPFQAQLPGRTVAPYYPGTGPAPTRAGVALDSLVTDATHAADDAGLTTMDVVGYSLGSAIAVRLAARYPGRVRRLVLVAGLAYASPSLQLTCETWSTLLARGGEPEGALAVGRFLAWVSSSEEHWTRTGGGAPGGPDAEAVAALIAKNIPPGTADLARLLSHLDVRAELAQVAAPTLVIVPTRDRLVHPSHSLALLAGIGGARRIDIPAGHNLAWEAPDRLREAVLVHLTDGA